MRTSTRLAIVIVIVIILPVAVAQAMHFSPWSSAQKVDEIAGNSPELNTPYLDGCPMESPDGLSLYMASNRPRFVGDTRTDLDIWVAHRESANAPWGAPEKLPPPINTAADDFCPTPVRGKGLFFVSRRAITGVTCGLGDIYFTRLDAGQTWSDPRHLDCAPTGPNTALDEQGPSYVEVGEQALLYFSSGSPTVPGDIFVSTQLVDGGFGPASPVSELNSAGNDIQPNVRKDGREVVFSSNRPGSLGQDIWVSTREDPEAAWSRPTNLGSAINTSAAETRPALSWDAQTLYFGRTPGVEGSSPVPSDIYVSTREKPNGSDG